MAMAITTSTTTAPRTITNGGGEALTFLGVHEDERGPYLHVRVNAPQGSTQRNGLLVPLGSEAPPLHELHRSLTRLSGNTLRVKT